MQLTLEQQSFLLTALIQNTRLEQIQWAGPDVRTMESSVQSAVYSTSWGNWKRIALMQNEDGLLCCRAFHGPTEALCIICISEAAAGEPSKFQERINAKLKDLWGLVVSLAS